MLLKDTKTGKNLLIAFAGESQARNRYSYFSSVAKKEGYVQIALIFEETSNQEKEHAKRLFKFMTGDMVEIQAAYPFGKISSTMNNLKSAAEGENYEHTTMYPSFAKIAKEEGFQEISDAFSNIAIAEKQHEKRYLALIKNIKDNKVFQKDKKVVWRCLNCGYIHENTHAPDQCPACMHPQSYYEVLAENW